MGEVQGVTPAVKGAKEEVANVLASATFGRSPRMSRLLSYLCQKIFSGEADQIKEYSIAIDLLGRPPSFDPATDAIARVEVHRLRKKLKEYYECEGFDRKLRIVIPSGSYVPTFVPAESVAGETKLVVPPSPPAKDVPPGGPSAIRPAESPATSGADAGPLRRQGRQLLVVGAAAALVMIAGALAMIRNRSGVATPLLPADAPQVTEKAGSEKPSQPRPAGAPLFAAAGETVRVATGRNSPYRDSSGNTWAPDRGYSGGEALEFAGQYVDGTPDPDLFRSARTGNFYYDLPLGRGTWEMHLYFAEMQYGPGFARGGGENSRVFHVLANNKRILSDFDVISDAPGARVADARVFKDITADAAGRLRLNFISNSGPAMVSAIELTPGRPHRINPIRICTRDSSYKDSTGQMWSRDQYWRGGRTNEHASPVTGTPDPELYARERYGNFEYAIPVADGGLYDLTLHFAETYWGPENPGGGGTGSRVFDVFCNGLALVRNLDVYSQAGANHAYVMTFKALKPNAQGKLNVSFVPVRNYASVYAIAVDDVTP